MRMGLWISMSTQLMMILVLMVGVPSFTEAQSNGVNDCATKLTPCLDYFNSSNPPATCCNPLKEAVATQLTCLCNLYATPGLLESLKINITQAIQLSRNCGVSGDLSQCKAPSPTAGSTPTGGGKDGEGAADRLAFTGISLLLLFWVSVMFY
ncbi:Lipid transfer protein [Quillaja saponaria]|uniref:Lipid transfer protein n=1 Tax=Quillaja saponaria TaxID=32244 RepID=A0AAD7P758_QUISA|nr:Lipid transfer protein [Quillaja saponaria]